MNRNIVFSVLYFVGMMLASVMVSCGGEGSSQRQDIDRSDSGVIYISVDESFQPVIDSEIQVFQALHPKAKIIAEYKPEAECLKDLEKDSTRMVIVSRFLTREEERGFKEKLSFYPSSGVVAWDAIALIVNQQSPDTVLYQADIRSILNGSIGGNKKVVFDGVKGSSVLTYVQDSILRGQPLDTSRAFGVNGSEEVLRRVENDKNLIGFVGVSWIGNPEDTAQLSFLMKVHIASVNCRCPEKSFVKPYQYNILTYRYPYVRGLVYILKENYSGLGSSFVNFMESERGQLIFKRAYLGPAKINFLVRPATST